MKARFFTKYLVMMMVLSSMMVQAQFDDLYYDYKKDEIKVKKTPDVGYNDDYSDQTFNDEL